METIFLMLNVVTIVVLLFSIVYTVGVIWRVERKLDTSYKFFLFAILFLCAAELLELFFPIGSEARMIALTVKALHSLFAVCFLFGVLFMRDIVRDLVGEDGSVELSERNKK